MPNASAQTPDGWDWSSKLATAQTESASSIAVDTLNGAVYTAGQADKGFSGILGGLWSLLFGNNTASDGYLVKQDLDGAVQWRIVIGGGGNDGMTGVCTDVQGNVYVTGYFSGSNASFTGVTGSSQTMSSNGGEDIFVVCYNGNGVLQWKVRAGGAGNDRGNGICVSNGQLSVGGYYSGSPVLLGLATPTPSAGSATTTHAFLLALQASDGSGQWLVTGSNTENSAINAVATDGARVYSFGVHKGTSYSFGSSAEATSTVLSTLGNNISADVLATSTSGTINWAQSISNPVGDEMNALGLGVSATGLYISGSSHNNSIFPGNTPVSAAGNPHDYGYLARLNRTSGQTVWVRTFSGTMNHVQTGRTIATDRSGDVVFGGCYRPNVSFLGGRTLTGNNDLEIFLAKVNSNGTLKWVLTPTGQGDDRPNGVAVDGSGRVYLAGSYSGDVTFNTAFSDDNSQNLFTARLTDLDYAVSTFRDPSEFTALGPICASAGPIDLTSLLIPAKTGTGSSVYSSSGIGSSGSNGPGGALGQMPGGVAVFDNANDQIVIDIGEIIPIGEKVIIRWRSIGGTAMMNVQGSLAGAGGFIDHGTITTASPSMVMTPVVVTAPMCFLKLTRTGTTTCEVDGIFYNFGSANDGTWSGDGIIGSQFDPSGLSGNVDITYSSYGHGTTQTVAVSPPSIAGTLEGGGAICPGSDAPISLSGMVGGSIIWQTSTDGGISWGSVPSDQPMDTILNVTEPTDVRVEVSSGVCSAVTSSILHLEPLDTIAPVLSGCPGNITAYATATSCTATVNYTMPTATDNCTGPVTVAPLNPAHAPGSEFPRGTTSVTIQGSDAFGNAGQCSFTVQVLDTVKPSIVCPPAKTVSMNSGCTAIGVALGTPVTSDNCGIVTVSNNAPAVFPKGITTVLWTATDASGNSRTCLQNVTVTDNTPPSITCPPDKSVSATSGCAAVAVPLGVPVTSDNCSIASVTHDATNTFAVGTTVVTWVVMDNSGNTNSCTQRITVIDNIPPTISCPTTVQVNANAGCTAVNVPLGIPAGADNCDVTSLTNNAPSVFPIGITTVTWTATDAFDNAATCAQTVIVNDISPPVISCPVNVQATTNNGCTATGVNLGTPNASDNCSGVTVTNNAPTAFPKGNTTVTWTATDASGNTATCSQTVTVTDNVPPSISCPPAVQATTNSGCSATGVNLGTPTASDNCGGVTVSNDAPASFPVGTTTVTWTATDASGNSAYCSQTVTVADNILPTITCPGSVQVQTNSGCTATGVILGTPLATDNCTVVTVINNAPTAFPKGTTMVTWTVTDASGNTASCTQTVTVTDNIPPVISCPANVQATTNNGCTATGVNLGTPNASDNCSGSTVTNNAPTAFPKGNTTVTWTATDASGNTATCSQTVTVTDNVPPTITCPPSVQATTNSGCSATGVNLGTATASDNCGDVTVSNDAPASFPIGTTTVTWTATDASGNSTSCAQTVTVTDVIAPDITAPPDLDLATNTGCTATGVALGTPTYDDNCSGTTISNDAPLVFPLGSTLVTWTATDASGNITTSTQSVTVSHQSPPVAICKEATVSMDATGWAHVTPAMVNNGSWDNCTVASLSVMPQDFNTLGDHVVILTVLDAAGNSTTCTSTVHVVDNAFPIAICRPDTIHLDPSGEGILNAIDLDGGSTDNGSIVAYTASRTHFTCSDIGTSGDTLFVTDNGGNTSFCVAQVTVIDTVRPVVMCRNMTVYLNGSGEVGIEANDLDNGSNDACGQLTFSASDTAFTCADIGVVNVGLTVTDVNGNHASCAAQVTVLDTIVPVALCQAVTAYLDATGHAHIMALDVDAGSTDNCSISTRVVSPTVLQGAGPHTAQLIVTDGSGNSANCTTEVTVLDTLVPTALCKDTVLQLTTSGSVSITAIDLDGGSADNAGITLWASSGSVFGCADIGPNPDTLFVSDASGNTSYCVATVTITDPFPAHSGTDSTVHFCDSGASSSLFTYLGGNAQTGGSWWFQGQSATGQFDPAQDVPGDYLYTVTNASGCQRDSSVITVLVHAMGDPGQDTSITVCSSDTAFALLELLPGADLNGTWSNGTGWFHPGTDLPGPIFYTVEGASVCPSTSATVAIQVDTAPNAGTGGIMTICVNASPVPLFPSLEGAPDAGGHWSDPQGASATGLFDPSTMTAGSYTYTMNGSAVCAPASSTLLVTLIPLPSATWNSPDPICASSDAIDLSAFVTGVTGGSWSGAGVSPGSSQFDPGNVPLQGASTAIELTYTATAEGCSASVPGTIIVLASPVADAGNDASVCGLGTSLDASATNGTGHWTAPGDVVILSADSPNTAMEVNAPGTYEMQWTVTNGQCTGSDDVQVTFHIPEQLVALDAGPDESWNIKRSFQLQAVADGATESHWSLIGGSGHIHAPDELTTEVSELGSGANTFLLSARVGVCPFIMDTVVLVVHDLFIPSGYSPNGDGVNDNFEIIGIDVYRDNELIVLNRWGQVVYQAVGYANEWNGQGNNGSPLPDDTYFYVLKFTGDATYNGQVIIKR